MTIVQSQRLATTIVHPRRWDRWGTSQPVLEVGQTTDIRMWPDPRQNLSTEKKVHEHTLTAHIPSLTSAWAPGLDLWFDGGLRPGPKCASKTNRLHTLAKACDLTITRASNRQTIKPTEAKHKSNEATQRVSRMHRQASRRANRHAGN